MATEVRAFTVNVPAGTLSTAPITAPMVFPPRRVQAVQVIVPPGPSGLVGWAILVGGVRVIPYLSDPWVITAAENITWPLEGYPDSGSWAVQAYNTGAIDHAIYFRWLLENVTSKAATTPQMIDDTAIIPPTSINPGQTG